MGGGGAGGGRRKQTTVIAFVTKGKEARNQWPQLYLQLCVCIFHQHAHGFCETPKARTIHSIERVLCDF